MTAPRVTRYRCPSPAERTVRRVLRSPFARDLRDACNAAFYPLMIGAGLIVAVTVLIATRGDYVGWDGLHHMPVGAR